MKTKQKSKKDLLREVIKKIVKKTINEGIRPPGEVDTEISEQKLPDEFVRQMINHADRYTSKRFRMQIWESNWSGKLKTPESLIKELKSYIDKTKHDDFMLFTEVLMTRFGLKKPEAVAKDTHFEKVKEKKKK